MKRLLLAVLVLLVLSTVSAAQKNGSSARFETCRAKLKQANKLELLHDLSWNRGQLPRVVVGPTFFSVPFETKQGFAETVNCFLMAGGDGCINFYLRDWRTDKRVAQFSSCRLKVD